MDITYPKIGLVPQVRRVRCLHCGRDRVAVMDGDAPPAPDGHRAELGLDVPEGDMQAKTCLDSARQSVKQALVSLLQLMAREVAWATHKRIILV
jgi:hypothetical protein